MKLIARIFRRKPVFFPILGRFGEELLKRYGARCYQGQIDRTLRDLKISMKLKDYAYAFYLRDEDYIPMKTAKPRKFRRIEKEIENYLKSRPALLGKGNFYESRIGLQGGASSAMR